jgi:multidrug resistance efflux pump
LEAALAKERLAREDLLRAQRLYREGAISQQALDIATANFDSAQANRKADEEAYRRAQLGTPREELDQARQAYRQAKAALDLAQAGYRTEDIAAARAEVAAAEANLRLLLRGTRWEDIRAAKAKLRQAQATLTALRHGNREEAIAQARAAAKAAHLAASALTDNLKERILFAPKAGRIERILVAVGDLIAPGAAAVRLADPNDLWLRVYLPEADLAKVRPGDEAVLAVDGIAKPVAAYVESIATQGEFTPANLQTPQERGKQVFGLRLRLKQPDPRVKAGMYATVKRVGQWP